MESTLDSGAARSLCGHRRRRHPCGCCVKLLYADVNRPLASVSAIVDEGNRGVRVDGIVQREPPEAVTFGGPGERSEPRDEGGSGLGFRWQA